MANMSYCRFHNTLEDLEDCKNALENRDIESSSEKGKAKALIELCQEIVDNYDSGYVDSIRTDEDSDEEDEEE